MSVATQQQSANGGRQTTTSPLDAAISVTERRRKIIQRAADFLGVPADKICGLLRNVWSTSKGQPPLTDQEMFSGLSMIARYELDPIAREIYVTRDGKGRLMTVIGIDGIVKILDRTDHYDGFTQDCEADEAGKMIACTTTIYSKRRTHPTVYRALASEYGQLGGFMAGKIPSHMLRLFSLRHATRLFTPLGGHVVTEDEARIMSQAGDSETTEPATLDEVAEEIERSLAKPVDDGNGQTEPAAEETAEPEPQAEPSAGTANRRLPLSSATWTDEEINTIDECQTALDSATRAEDCDTIKSVYKGRFSDDEITLPLFDRLMELIEARQEEVNKSARRRKRAKAKA